MVLECKHSDVIKTEVVLSKLLFSNSVLFFFLTKVSYNWQLTFKPPLGLLSNGTVSGRVKS